MWKKPLVWKAEPGSAPDSAFSAQLGNLITYYAVSRTYGHPAYVELRGPRGGLKRLDLGYYVKIEQAILLMRPSLLSTLIYPVRGA